VINCEKVNSALLRKGIVEELEGEIAVTNLNLTIKAIGPHHMSYCFA